MKKSIALQSLAMLAFMSSSNTDFGKNKSPEKFIKLQNIEPKIPSTE